MHSSSSPSGLSLPSMMPSVAAATASAAPAAASGAQSLEAALALVTRSQAEIDALHILRHVPPGRRSASQVHEVYNWLSSAHPRLFAEFSASAIMGRELCARLRYEAFARRDILFSQTDRAEDMYCLLRGSVSIWALPAECFSGVDPGLLAATKQKLVAEMTEASRALASSRAEVRSRSKSSHARRGQHSRGRSLGHVGPSARAHSPMPPVPADVNDAEGADASIATASATPPSPQQPQLPLQRRVSLDEASAENSPHGSRRGSFSGGGGDGSVAAGPSSTARSSATSASSSHTVAAESILAAASPSASPASPANSLRAVTPQSAAARGSVARTSSTHARSHTLAAGALLSPSPATSASGASRKLGLSHHHHGASVSIARSVSPAPHAHGHGHASGNRNHGAGGGAGSDLPSLASAVSSATSSTHHTPSPPALSPSAASSAGVSSHSHGHAHASPSAAPAAHAAPTSVNHTLYTKRSKRSEAKDHLLDPPPVPQLLLKLAEALGVADPWKWRMMLLGHLRPGGMKQIFGEAGLLQPDGERSATIRAEDQATEVLVLCKADFAELLQGSYHKDLNEKFEAMLKIDLLHMHVPYIGGGSGVTASGNGAKATPRPSPSASQTSLHPATAATADASSPSKLLSSSPSTAALTALLPQQSSAPPSGDGVATTASASASVAAAPAAASAATLDLSHPTIGYLRKVALYFEFRIFGLRTQIVRQHAPASMVYCIVSGECEIVHELPMPQAPAKGSEEERMMMQQQAEAEEAESASVAAGGTPRRSLANSALHAKLQQQHLASHSYSGRRAKVTYRPPPQASSTAAAPSRDSADSNSSASSSALSSRTVLIGLLGAGQCFGELDHLAPSNGLHPFGLRTRSLGGPVVVLLISREDFNKRVLAALVDRPTLKKLRARDAWRAQRAADLEARGSLAEMLAASAPNRILNAKSQHQQHLQAMQKQQAAALSAAGSASAPASARGAASSSSLSSPPSPRPPARALNPSGQGGWQSIRDLGEQPLQMVVAALEVSSSPSLTAHKIAAVVATEDLSHYPSLHYARSHALPLSSLTASGSTSSLKLALPPVLTPVAPSNAFVRTQTLQGPPMTDRSRYSGGVGGGGGGGVSGDQYTMVATSSTAKLLTPSPSTVRLLQAHRTSYAALPSSVAVAGAGSGSVEHKEQAAPTSNGGSGGGGGMLLYSPSLSHLLPLSPPAAPAPLPSSFALGREVAASLSLRALEHERALLRLRAERLARAGDVARLTALKERAATSRYKLGSYEVPSGKQLSRLDDDNIEALAKLGVLVPRNRLQQQQHGAKQQQQQQQQQSSRRPMQQQQASAHMGSYASASVLAGMLRVMQPEETEVLPEPFFIVENV